MKRRRAPEIDYTAVVCLLKAFDVNYMSDEDFEKISGLDANEEKDVAIAVGLVLRPEFGTFGAADRLDIPASVQKLLSNPDENFEVVFDNLGLGFKVEVADKRLFLQQVLKAL
jgi:hypothetical protein